MTHVLDGDKKIVLLIRANTCDYVTYYIGKLQKLRWVCASMQSCKSFQCYYTQCMEMNDWLGKQKGNWIHWVAEHAQFTISCWEILRFCHLKKKYGQDLQDL